MIRSIRIPCFYNGHKLFHTITSSRNDVRFTRKCRTRSNRSCRKWWPSLRINGRVMQETKLHSKMNTFCEGVVIGEGTGEMCKIYLKIKYQISSCIVALVNHFHYHHHRRRHCCHYFKMDVFKVDTEKRNLESRQYYDASVPLVCSSHYYCHHKSERQRSNAKQRNRFGYPFFFNFRF
jgi:hypothetical protein